MDAEHAAERRTCIGSSDSPRLFGFWGQPLSVYLDKLGLLPDTDSPAMRAGRMLEDVVAQMYAEVSGYEVAPPPVRLMRHPDMPWLGASLDRVSLRGPVEIKTSRTADGWGEPGTDEIPDAYMVQVQHQLLVACAVSGVDMVADVAVLIGGQELRTYTVLPCPELQGIILDAARDIWQRIEAREPPDPDWAHPDTPRLLSLLHRPDEEVVAELGPSQALALDEYQRLGRHIADLEAGRERRKAEIIAAMRDAGAALLPDGRTVRRRVVSVKAQVRDAYSFTNFTISQPKKSRSKSHV
jgi:putative phage-type endonuclease